MQFDHIGIVVPNLQRGRKHLASLFDLNDWTDEVLDEGNGVFVQFGRDQSGICYEIIAPFGPDSPIHQALQTKRGIINHVAYLVENLDAEAERMRACNCVIAGPARPAVAYHGRRIQFFVSPLRFIVELIEAPGHVHSYGRDVATRES